MEDVLVVELKCAERLSNEHTAQSLSSLGPDSVSARPFPETQGRMEANRPRISDSRTIEARPFA
jgi:hypothetical protein